MRTEYRYGDHLYWRTFRYNQDNMGATNSEAVADCQAGGGHLASYTSAAEESAVTQHVMYKIRGIPAS